jgi:hypothetical protein
MRTETRTLSGLGRMFRQQRELQMALHDGTDPADFTTPQMMEYLREQALALINEVNEALAEVGWKSWATSTHINREAFVSELRDTWQHLMNLMLLVGVTPGELVKLTTAKQKVNFDRIAHGYDGVTTKCPQCHRAYDDAAVHCTPAEPFGPGGADELRSWCEVSAKYRHTHPIVDPVNGHGTIAGYKLASDCPGTPHRGHTEANTPCPLDQYGQRIVPSPVPVPPATDELRLWTCGNCGVPGMTQAEHSAHLRSADHKRVTDTR